MFFWNQYNETPMTQAVISGNLAFVKRLAHSMPHRSAKNYLGFDADNLALYLFQEEMMDLFGLRIKKEFKVVKKGSTQVKVINIPEYESFFQTRYVPSVVSSSYRELYKVIKKCPGPVKSGLIGEDMRALFDKNSEKIKRGYVSDVIIKWVDEKMGYGLFANEPIKKGEFIGEYAGLLIIRYLVNGGGGDYCMRYPNLSLGLMHYTLDAEKLGNEMRFANHNYTPNMQPTVALENGLSHSALVALRDIEPGEQLTYDYGEDYWSRRDPPIDF